MTGLALGLTAIVSTFGAPAVTQTPHAPVTPTVLTINIAEVPATAPDVIRLPNSRPRALAATARRPSKLERVVAIGTGATLGFFAGGIIGGKLTENRDNPDDDTSAIRGIVIGAPIGAVLGGLTAYWLTK